MRAALCAALLWGVATGRSGRAQAVPCALPSLAAPTRAQVEAAYRQAPSLEGLYELGQAACREGDAAAGADLLHRYRHDDPAASAERRQQADESWARRGVGVEMAVTIGNDGDFLVVDGRLLGALPLGLPLWLGPGPHRLTVEQRGKERLSIQCTLDQRQHYYALQRNGGDLSCSTPLTVLVAGQGAQGAALSSAVQEALQRDPVVLPLQAEMDGRCADDDCALTQAGAAQATYLLVLRRQGAQVTVALWDVALQDRAGNWREDCANCDAGDLGRRLRHQVPGWVREGTNRGRGELQVQSRPPGAAVLLDGRRRGVTPLTLPVLAGPRQVRVEIAGHRPEARAVEVPADGAVPLQVDLAAVVVRMERRPRPRWRLITGGVTITAGAVLMGLGASALATSGTCKDPPPSGMGECNFLYDTTAIGAGLFGAGVVLGIAGGVLMALPGERHQIIQVGSIGTGLRLASFF